MMRILLIADDLAPAHLLRRRLWRQGHVVAVAPTEVMGLQRAEGDGYDAIILDVRLPGADGMTLTTRLRAAGVVTPILLLSTRDTLDARLSGLDAGADDCLAAPFSFDELVARVRAVARRGETPARGDLLIVGPLVLDRRTRIVRRGDRTLTLAPKEIALLEYLMRHPAQALTRAVLRAYVWDDEVDLSANVVDAAIKRLRKAVDTGDTPSLIHTVRGVGYKIQAPRDSAEEP
jgi:DNA-binding response OmpR family regulator